MKPKSLVTWRCHDPASSNNDYIYTSLPYQEAPNLTTSSSSSVSSSSTTTSPPSSPTSAFTLTSSPPPHRIILTTSSYHPLATAELFPGLRGERLARLGLAGEHVRGIGHLLGIVDDVQQRHRDAYADEEEETTKGGWNSLRRFFLPDAHRHLIRDHKVGDWMIVAHIYWEALCAVRRATGARLIEDDEGCEGIGNDNTSFDIEYNGDNKDENNLIDVRRDVTVNANADRNDEDNLCEDKIEDEEMDGKYDGVVTALKGFIKASTALKDKALKDKMQVNKQRYTHTGQWLNFITLGAGVFLYVKNTFFLSLDNNSACPNYNSTTPYGGGPHYA